MSTNKLPKPSSFATSLICCFKDTMKKDLKLLFFSELYFNHLVNSVTLVYQNKFSVRAALFERKKSFDARGKEESSVESRLLNLHLNEMQDINYLDFFVSSAGS